MGSEGAKAYFIVGGAGFIGSHFCDALLARPDCRGVTIYDNFSSGRDWHFAHHLADARFSVVRGDVHERDRLTAAMRGHDVVIHLASNPDIARAMTEPDIDFREGTALTNGVVEAMRVSGVGRILYASGSGVYGEAADVEFREDHHPMQPISTYGASKLAGEALICAYSHMFGITGLCFRFGNVVGPRQTHGVGFDFVKRLVSDPTRLRILGDGSQNTDLIILAARPSVGKTAFALNLARNACLHPAKPTPVAFFSLEMSAGQLVQRILSAESEILLEKIARGKLEDHEMQQLSTKGIQRLAKAPMFIDDTAALNIFELRAKCRRLKNKHNIGLVIIDYLQLMSGSGDRNTNREQEISRISRDLKSMAKELQIPIIALSQLSREVEKRKENNKVPQLSDLRESGAIEQDSDLVMFLYRPELYDLNANEFGESNKGETMIRIAKHRNGSLENIRLRSLLQIQKFTEWGNDDPPEMGSGRWRPVPTDTGGTEQGGARLYFQAGSKMNDLPMDDGEEPAL